MSAKRRSASPNSSPASLGALETCGPARASFPLCGARGDAPGASRQPAVAGTGRQPARPRAALGPPLKPDRQRRRQGPPCMESLNTQATPTRPRRRPPIGGDATLGGPTLSAAGVVIPSRHAETATGPRGGAQGGKGHAPVRACCSSRRRGRPTRAAHRSIRWAFPWPRLRVRCGRAVSSAISRTRSYTPSAFNRLEARRCSNPLCSQDRERAADLGRRTRPIRTPPGRRRYISRLLIVHLRRRTAM